MVFNPNTDVNYASYLSLTNPLDGWTKARVDEALIKNFCLQATNAATLSSGAAFTTIINTCISSAKQGNLQF